MTQVERGFCRITSPGLLWSLTFRLTTLLLFSVRFLCSATESWFPRMFRHFSCKEDELASECTFFVEDVVTDVGPWSSSTTANSDIVVTYTPKIPNHVPFFQFHGSASALSSRSDMQPMMFGTAAKRNTKLRFSISSSSTSHSTCIPKSTRMCDELGDARQGVSLHFDYPTFSVACSCFCENRVNALSSFILFSVATGV